MNISWLLFSRILFLISQSNLIHTNVTCWSSFPFPICFSQSQILFMVTIYWTFMHIRQTIAVFIVVLCFFTFQTWVQVVPFQYFVRKFKNFSAVDTYFNFHLTHVISRQGHGSCRRVRSAHVSIAECIFCHRAQQLTAKGTAG